MYYFDAVNFACLSVSVNLNAVHLQTLNTEFLSGDVGSLLQVFSLPSSSSLIVLQFGNVLVEVQRIRVRESSSLRHLSASNHLFHCHLHLLTADGVLQRNEEKGLSFTPELTFTAVTIVPG